MHDNPLRWNPVAVLDAIETAVLVMAPDRSVVGLNQAAQELLAIGKRSALGRRLAEIAGFPSTVHASVESVLNDGAAQRLRSVRVRRRLGEPAAFDMLISVYGDGLLLQMDGLAQPDRTDTAPGEHNRMMLRGLAHEIKNPLGGLRGAAQLLAGELDDPALHEYTDVIIAESDRLTRLVDRLSGPQSQPRFDSINVHRVTERVRQVIEVNLPPGVELVVSYDPSLPRLRADPERLVQALLNIALNAVHAVGESGEVAIRTRAVYHALGSAERHCLVAEIQLADTGPGVDEDMRDRLFVPMISSKSEGSGLGLPIAQSLIEQHGGTIEWRSSPGETVFSVYLPLGHDDV